MNNRVVGYVRVSTDNQIENYSIEEQNDRIKAFCKAKDWNLTNIYTDGGYSGGNTNRPALLQMLKDIENGLIDMIIVYKLDRLSRSQKDTLMLIEDNFISSNVNFVSISENFDTSTPFGRAMIGILSVFAQLEKDQITERFTMGRIGRAKNGYYHGGSIAPTGYDYVDGNLVVNEYEAHQVREVFRLFLEGNSVNSIQKFMSENYTNQHGNWSSHTLILNILRNNLYIGKVKFKKNEYEGNHIPIVSNEVFEQSQQLLKSQTRYEKNPYTKTPFKANNLLTSILYCKKCGARFTGNHGKYVCYSRGKTNKDQIKDPNCKNKRWDISELDNVTREEVLRLIFDESYFNNLVSSSKDVPSSNKDNIINRINELDKQIARMIDLYQVGNIPLEQISERISKLKNEKDTISEQLADEQQTKITVSQAKEILKRGKQILDKGNLPQQRLLISSLIDYVEIDDNKIDIHWSFI